MTDRRPTATEIRTACAHWRTRTFLQASADKVRESISALYDAGDMPPPRRIEIVPSPFAMAKPADRFRRGARTRPGSLEPFALTHPLWHTGIGCSDHGLLHTVREELGPRESIAQIDYDCELTHGQVPEIVALELQHLQARPYLDVLQACASIALDGSYALVSHQPVEHHVDARGALHCDSGPAIVYADGTKRWAWHGVIVERRAIEVPDTLLLGDLEVEGRLRRALIDRYGLGRYLVDAGAESIARDETGELFRLEQPDDEPIVAVRVVDRVRDAHGAPREHWLRVPPQLRSARAAVAWTFGVEPRRYRPKVET